MTEKPWDHIERAISLNRSEPVKKSRPPMKEQFNEAGTRTRIDQAIRAIRLAKQNLDLSEEPMKPEIARFKVQSKVAELRKLVAYAMQRGFNLTNLREAQQILDQHQS